MKMMIAAVAAMIMLPAMADEVTQADRKLLEKKLTEHPFCGPDCRRFIAPVAIKGEARKESEQKFAPSSLW